MTRDLRDRQRRRCVEHSAVWVEAANDAKVGIALQTLGQEPINGLRHQPTGDTTGWYIWCGETLSQAPDFFAPLHVAHLNERCAAVLEFLGLPPGYRFLLAGQHIDVWYDASLLENER